MISDLINREVSSAVRDATRQQGGNSNGPLERIPGQSTAQLNGRTDIDTANASARGRDPRRHVCLGEGEVLRPESSG